MAGLTLRDEIALAVEAGFEERHSHTTTYDDKTEVYVLGHAEPIVVLPVLEIAFPGWVSKGLAVAILGDAQCILDLVIASEYSRNYPKEEQ